MFDADDKLFVGRIAGIRDIISFHTDNVKTLEVAFHEAVDDYLAACAKLKQAACKSLDTCFAKVISKEPLKNSVRPEPVEGHLVNGQGLRQAQPERLLVPKHA